MSQQTWTVVQWDAQDAGVLGAVIECVVCADDEYMRPGCEMCDGQGTLFQPYHLPNGASIDLFKHAELLIRIPPPEEAVPSDS